MCTNSGELLIEHPLTLGQHVVIDNIPSYMKGTVLGFAPIHQTGNTLAGICLKNGWGVMFRITPSQLKLLKGLPASLGDESGAAVFARFYEGVFNPDKKVATDDRFVFEIPRRQPIEINLDKEFLGIRFEVVAKPGEKWPPDRVVDVAHRKSAVIPSRVTTAQMIAG